MLKSVYALVGTDLFLQLDKLRELLALAPKDVQRIDLDGETAELAQVLDEVRSFAMFSSRKLVIVRSAGAFISRFREALEQYVAKPVDGSTLVLRVDSMRSTERIYKAIAARGEICNCNAPAQKDLAGWISRRAQQGHKLKMDSAAAQALAEMIGNDLGRLDNELAKLALQCDKGVADATAIAKSVAFQREQEMWDMTDEVAGGNIAKALERWRHLVQSDTSAEYRATTWLTMWLEKVRKALVMRRQGRAEGQIARDLKIWPMEKQRPFFQTAMAIGEDGASRLIDLLADLDHRAKSGLGDMTENIERFLMAVKRKQA